MGPWTSIDNEEYKKVGLVGNVAIKKSLIFYQQEKNHKFRGHFSGQNLSCKLNRGVVAHLGGLRNTKNSFW